MILRNIDFTAKLVKNWHSMKFTTILFMKMTGELATGVNAVFFVELLVLACKV